MTTREELPTWAELARRKWTHVGASRPSFAVAPGPGQESVWDYPRPPALVADEREVRVELGGVVIAQSGNAVRVLETSHPPTFYVPRADVRMEHFHRAQGSSRCEWKGTATYWDVEAGGQRVAKGAWSYEKPFADFASLAGYLSFYPALFACYVDDHRVLAQPGDFYGGWITPELVGPFKGNSGTSGW